MLIDIIKEVYRELQIRKIVIQQFIALEDLRYDINQLCDELKAINEDITLIEEFLTMKKSTVWKRLLKVLMLLNL